MRLAISTYGVLIGFQKLSKPAIAKTATFNLKQSLFVQVGNMLAF